MTNEELRDLARKGDIIPVAQEADRARVAEQVLLAAVRAKDELLARVEQERDAARAQVEQFRTQVSEMTLAVATANERRLSAEDAIVALKKERDEATRTAVNAVRDREAALAQVEKWKEAARIRGERADELENERGKLQVECNKLRAEAHRAHRRVEVTEQAARVATMALHVDLEALRKFVSQLEEALLPAVLISYATNHPEHTRHDTSMLKWNWETLDKVAQLFAQESAFLKRVQSGLFDYRRAVEAELRAWWADAMGNLPGPALPNLLERIQKLLPFPDDTQGPQS